MKPPQLNNPQRTAPPSQADLDQDLCALTSPALADRLKHVFKHAPTRYRLFARAWTGKATRGQAIKAKCLDCCGLQSSEVTKCAAIGCPLWAFRPYRRAIELNEDEAEDPGTRPDGTEFAP